MDRILITGTSGFIGTNMALAFKDKAELVCIDIKEPKTSEITKYWRNIDIRNFNDLKKSIDEFQPDYIIHLAARTDLDGKDIKSYDSNTIGVRNILKAIEGLECLKKIIITSSMLVCRGGYVPKHQYDYCPNTLYGESKVETENEVWSNPPHCDWAIIRPTSIWGPYFGVPYRNFFDMVLSRRYFHIGHKSCTKTYGYVGNAVYQIKQVLFNSTNDKDNKVFYIGDYEPYPIEEWANEIAKEVNIKIIRMPFWIINGAAKVGDFFKAVHIPFPMNSFRLKNMTTDNVVKLDNTKALIPDLPFTRINGIRETLKWLDSYNGSTN